ncbi:hypothetical protein PQR15_14330 [Streptomyces lydicus]|nr:hypothetical protein [Streptomyces lydicus]
MNLRFSARPYSRPGLRPLVGAGGDGARPGDEGKEGGAAAAAGAAA